MMRDAPKSIVESITLAVSYHTLPLGTFCVLGAGQLAWR